MITQSTSPVSGDLEEPRGLFAAAITAAPPEDCPEAGPAVLPFLMERMEDVYSWRQLPPQDPSSLAVSGPETPTPLITDQVPRPPTTSGPI